MRTGSFVLACIAVTIVLSPSVNHAQQIPPLSASRSSGATCSPRP